jgi:hypothetical protein
MVIGVDRLDTGSTFPVAPSRNCRRMTDVPLAAPAPPVLLLFVLLPACGSKPSDTRAVATLRASVVLPEDEMEVIAAGGTVAVAAPPGTVSADGACTGDVLLLPPPLLVLLAAGHQVWTAMLMSALLTVVTAEPPVQPLVALLAAGLLLLLLLLLLADGDACDDERTLDCTSAVWSDITTAFTCVYSCCCPVVLATTGEETSAERTPAVAFPMGLPTVEAAVRMVSTCCTSWPDSVGVDVLLPLLLLLLLAIGVAVAAFTSAAVISTSVAAVVAAAVDAACCCCCALPLLALTAAAATDGATVANDCSVAPNELAAMFVTFDVGATRAATVATTVAPFAAAACGAACTCVLTASNTLA